MCVNRAWGTVCGYYSTFGPQEAGIVCRQIGGQPRGTDL